MHVSPHQQEQAPLRTAILHWLSKQAFPLWSERGVDSKHGGFVEEISFSGIPTDLPRRLIVQARQIYCFRTAHDLQLMDQSRAVEIVDRGIQKILQHYSLPEGAFAYSADQFGKIIDSKIDLYSQAFALFGLAHAYALLEDPEIKNRALVLLDYLQTKRRAPNGGFTEWTPQGPTFEANPHMHLFEALLIWQKISPDVRWEAATHEILDLCLNKFIQKDSGILAEHFDQNWMPLVTKEIFVYEPGHHYEWTWLLWLYETIYKKPIQQKEKLFSLADRTGIHTRTEAVIDEVNSDFTIRNSSARYWPQCERIKAALRLAEQNQDQEKSRYFQAADKSLQLLLRYLETPIQGHVFDYLQENNEFFQGAPPKASCLYHVVNAMEEYLNVR